MITLAIDTSTDTAGVALLDGEEVRCETFLNTGAHHSFDLLPAIDSVFVATGTAPGDMDLFACTIGPGSFTGLRVGACTIKGLAFATGKPVVGISTLEALAANVPDYAGDVCPLLDAQNGKVYTALYRNRQGIVPEKIVDESMVDINDLLQDIRHDTVFLGTGARKYAGLIAARLPGKGRIASVQDRYIRAAVVGLLGLEKFRAGDVMDVRIFTPRYLQPSYAEKLVTGR
jgi:tRNA threonylcarbamoyladenosine biosynthesis protein TsaB